MGIIMASYSNKSPNVVFQTESTTNIVASEDDGADGCTCNKGKVNRIIICGLIGIIAVVLVIVALTLDKADISGINSSAKLFKKTAVAAEIYECSKLGKDILTKKNGSCVDAAIATILCNSVHNMHSSGIGGG